MKFTIYLLLILTCLGLGAYIITFKSGDNDKISTADKSGSGNQITEIIKQAVACREEGKIAEAIRLLKTALEENPGNFSLTLELAKSYEQNGDIDLAISTYEEARKINPDHYLPCRQLGFLYLREKKDTAKATEMFEISLQLNENQPVVIQTLAMLKDAGSTKKTPKPPKPPVPQPPHPTAPTIPTPTPPDPRPVIPKPAPTPGGN